MTQLTPSPDMGPLAKFSPSEQTIRAQIQLETLLEAAAKKASAGQHLNGKQVLEDCVVPLVGVMKVWVHMLMGDVMRFSTQTLVDAIPDPDDEEPEVLVGVPSDDVDAWLDALKSVLESVETLGGMVEKKSKTAAGKLVEEASARLEELANAIDELRLEVDEEYESLLGGDDDEDADTSALEPLIKE